MAIKINQPIVDYKVASKSDTPGPLFTLSEEHPVSQSDDNLVGIIAENKSNVVQMMHHERVERPEMLRGSTYKIKTPLSEHALYVTINDTTLNAGTPYERQRPFEIFINSKNMDNFQWTVALTRIISAVFRKGGDSTFLVEELHAVFDPRGGYFKKGGKFTPSLVAEIGSVIEMHMKRIGMIADEPLSENTKRILEEKRLEFEKRINFPMGDAESSFPDGAELCNVCSTRAMVYLDGCMTCLNCGESKCS